MNVARTRYTRDWSLVHTISHFVVYTMRLDAEERERRKNENIEKAGKEKDEE